MSPKIHSAMRRKLLRWYENNKRDLPWRRKRDPYAIWLSETMLQQTRVSVVIPYYENFLAEFPSIDALARARPSRVLRLWSGLGYYRRALNLQRAARQIARSHGGVMPDHFAGLAALPGVGAYTAGAILSIAFEKPYPALDGNARRVLGRVIGTSNERQLRTAAAALVPKARPGEFNQALMELGATICTPRNRRCLACVLRSLCASAGQSADSGRHRRMTKFKCVTWPLAIVRCGRRILMRRRGAGALLEKLWELPGGEKTARESIETFLRRHLEALGTALPRRRKLGVVRHAITHRRILAPVFLYELSGQAPFALPRADWRWVDPARLDIQATSSMTAKACRFLDPQ